MMKTVLKYAAFVAAGALGFVLMWILGRAVTVYQQHNAMWEWTMETDRLLHPQKYAAAGTNAPGSPPAQTPEPTPVEKKK